MVCAIRSAGDSGVRLNATSVPVRLCLQALARQRARASRQPSSNCSRREAVMRGSNMRSTRQKLSTCSTLFQNPTARPARKAAPSAVVSVSAGRTMGRSRMGGLANAPSGVYNRPPAGFSRMRKMIRDLVAAARRDAQHSGGLLEAAALEALALRLSLGSVEHTAETGCGASTLIFSYFSRSHLVFTVDCQDGSYRAVMASGWLKRGNVRFVLGPTQITLCKYNFTERFNLVLLDGPHAYPFPDLEYYYFYPHIVAGGWLVVDDIQIPSIRRMVEILSADDMWRVDEIVGRTAFLQRTDAPTFSPIGDSWWEQGYNRPAVPPRP